MKLGCVVRREVHNLKWLLEWVFFTNGTVQSISRWDGQKIWEILRKNGPAQHFLFYKGGNKAQRPHLSVLVEGSYEMRWRPDFVAFSHRLFAPQQWLLRALPRLAAPAPPEISLEVPLVRHHPRPRLQGWGPGCFNKLTRCFWCTLTLWEHLHGAVALS